jgi:hypothetical protein
VKVQTQPQSAIMSASPMPPTAATPSAPTPAADPHEQWLNRLYESPSIDDRLAAARQIAARNDERGMSDLATFINAAEENGEPSLLALAGQVAEMLSQMQGPEIEGLATELAYSPSVLVAEAAVNAAVKSQPSQNPQKLLPGIVFPPEDQQAIHDFTQQLLTDEIQNSQPTTEGVAQ